MARKQKPEDPPPSKAYLVSFGDTMTTLLAFFIVLCSLAEEQTEANLYRGTASFVDAMEAHGLPGIFLTKTTTNAIDRIHTNPIYVAPDLDENPPENNPTGPDVENGLRSIDRSSEVFQRFLNEAERSCEARKLRESRGEVVFDFFNRLPRQSPLLAGVYVDELLRVVPTLSRANYEVDLIVWATTPSPTAWNLAINRATILADELAMLANLKPEQLARLNAIGKPWRFSDLKRPVLTVIVRRLESQ